MDIKKVTAAIRIKISLERLEKKRVQLYKDLLRLKSSMTSEEFNEYTRRIAE
jgi:hypothetical protein